MHKLPLTGKAEFSVDRATPSPKSYSGARPVSMRELPKATLVLFDGQEMQPVTVESGTPCEVTISGHKLTIDLVGLTQGEILS